MYLDLRVAMMGGSRCCVTNKDPDEILPMGLSYFTRYLPQVDKGMGISHVTVLHKTAYLAVLLEDHMTFAKTWTTSKRKIKERNVCQLENAKCIRNI